MSTDLTTLRFEPFTENHLEAVLKIEARTHGAPWSEASFRNEIDSPQSIFIVAILNGEVVGYGGTWILVDESHITNVVVNEDLRGQGIGRRLMNEILKLSKERGAVCSTLEVRAGNAAAIHLYESMGYVNSGVRKGYYPNNREDAIVMWLHEI